MLRIVSTTPGLLNTLLRYGTRPAALASGGQDAGGHAETPMCRFRYRKTTSPQLSGGPATRPPGEARPAGKGGHRRGADDRDPRRRNWRKRKGRKDDGLRKPQPVRLPNIRIERIR